MVEASGSKRLRSVPTRFVTEEAPAKKKPRKAAVAPSKAKQAAKGAPPTKAAGAKGAIKPSQKKTTATPSKAKPTYT